MPKHSLTDHTSGPPFNLVLGLEPTYTVPKAIIAAHLLRHLVHYVGSGTTVPEIGGG